MSYTVNIGLARNDGQPDHAPHTVAGILHREFGGEYAATFAWRVHQSDTEQTLVAEWPYTPSQRDGYSTRDTWLRLSDELAQDCIAICVDVPAHYRADRFPAHDCPGGRRVIGDLIGPKAADWGPFNPQFFLGINGQRLA